MGKSQSKQTKPDLNFSWPFYVLCTYKITFEQLLLDKQCENSCDGCSREYPVDDYYLAIGLTEGQLGNRLKLRNRFNLRNMLKFRYMIYLLNIIPIAEN